MTKTFTLTAFFFFFASFSAHAEETVRVITHHPIPYAEYGDVHAEESLKVGPTAPAAQAEVYGDMDIIGGNLTLQGTSLSVAPGGGPYGMTALRADLTNNVVSIGNDDVYANSPKLKAHTALRAGSLYAVGDFPIAGSQVYLNARGFIDGGLMRGQYRALGHNTTPLNFGDDVFYAPMRIDGREVRLGEPAAERFLYDFQGHTDTVLVGTDTIGPTQAPGAQMLFQIGSPSNPGNITANSWQAFSSRSYKTDITPLSRADYSVILEKAAKIPVVSYLYKDEVKTAKRRIGILAEESPSEILTPDGKALNTADGLGFLAAALKELQLRNAELKTRLEALERHQTELSK